MTNATLVVFDLDGTLTQTSGVDGHYFVQAVTDAVGLDASEIDLSKFDHVTDSGILHGLFAEQRRRAPTPTEVQRIVDRFVDLLAARHREDPKAFVEVPGARALWADLVRHEGYEIAIATGGWERPARFKCDAVGLDVAACPSAFAEDGPSREAIVQAGIARARRAHGDRAFARVVSVGDAAWDVQTARALNLPFVGVGGADPLRSQGAHHVVRDYLDPQAFLRALEHARPPEPAPP